MFQAACKVVGISRNTVYRWRDEDDTFKKDWDNVAEEFYDNIETAMFSKATFDKDTTMLIWHVEDQDEAPWVC